MNRHAIVAVLLLAPLLLTGCATHHALFETPADHPANPDATSSPVTLAPSPFDPLPQPQHTSDDMPHMHMSQSGMGTNQTQPSRDMKDMKGMNMDGMKMPQSNPASQQEDSHEHH